MLHYLHRNLHSAYMMLYLCKVSKKVCKSKWIFIKTRKLGTKAKGKQKTTTKKQPLQTHPYNENRVPCNENRFFLVRKTSKGKLCFHYRDGFAVKNSKRGADWKRSRFHKNYSRIPNWIVWKADGIGILRKSSWPHLLCI